MLDASKVSPKAAARAERKGVVAAAASQTLRADQSGLIFVGAVDAVFTLPLASATPIGTSYTFVCGVASGGTGLSISPNALDGIYGNGLTGVVNKDLINTGATDVVGDSAKIVCRGAAGIAAWFIENITGTWAKEA